MCRHGRYRARVDKYLLRLTLVGVVIFVIFGLRLVALSFRQTMNFSLQDVNTDFKDSIEQKYYAHFNL